MARSFSREIRIVRGQPQAIGSLGKVQHIPEPHAQARKHVLGQDDTCGVADLGDLEGCVHTGVITFDAGIGNEGGGTLPSSSPRAWPGARLRRPPYMRRAARIAKLARQPDERVRPEVGEPTCAKCHWRQFPCLFTPFVD